LKFLEIAGHRCLIQQSKTGGDEERIANVPFLAGFAMPNALVSAVG
jgi:hypothetical protein